MSTEGTGRHRCMFASRLRASDAPGAMKPDPTHPSYRPDIDGLRAVAVLSVVGFHAFPGSFRGGFVSVDVFFVISGYLISKIIIGNLDRDRFSFADFYSRRVRRIFPALAVVLGACALAGWLVLLPGEYSQLGKHIAGGAAFVSNLVLLGEAGYFDGSAVTKPLLHLWSLGIEEQFYIVWPVLLWLARKRAIAFVLAAILVGSFVLDLVVLRAQPVTAFYSPFTRFWELLIGSTLAYVTLHRPAWLLDARPGPRNVASLVGAALIGAAILVLNAEQPFPGWRALLPTIGAYLIIAAGPEAFVNRRVLSQRLLVWVGLISFPLYLWHWPLLTFARIVEAATPSPNVRLGAVALSFLLAWLTYRFVETPVRLGKQKRSTVIILLASVAGLAFAGLGLVAKGGFVEARGPWNVSNVAQSYDRNDQFNVACRTVEEPLFSPTFDPQLDFCHSTASAKAEVVVLGDSHAGRLYSGLRAATTLPLLDLGRGSCLPFVGYEASNPGTTELLKCSPTMAHLVDRVLEPPPRVVVLNGFYARPYDGRVVLRAAEPMKVLMRDTLARLSSHVPKIIVVLDVPELPFDPSYCVDRPFHRGAGRGRCAFSKVEPDKQLALYEADLRGAAEGLPNVSFFNPADVLCEADSCFAVRDANLLYDDRHHLSRHGAHLVGVALERQLH